MINENKTPMFPELPELFRIDKYREITGRCKRAAYQDAKNLGFSVKIGKEIFIVKSKFIAYLECQAKTKTA